jgi:hypothetical protein
MKTLLRILRKFYVVICILMILNMTSRALQVKEERHRLYYSSSITMLTNEIKELKKEIKILKEVKQ